MLLQPEVIKNTFSIATSLSNSAILGNDQIDWQARNNYELVTSRILELTKKEDDDDDDDSFMPTDIALNYVLELLRLAYQNMPTFFPNAAVSPAFDGGIRVQWFYSNFSLRLIISGEPSKSSYIYFEDGDCYGTEDVSLANLLNRFVWLQHKLREV